MSRSEAKGLRGRGVRALSARTAALSPSSHPLPAHGAQPQSGAGTVLPRLCVSPLTPPSLRRSSSGTLPLATGLRSWLRCSRCPTEKSSSTMVTRCARITPVRRPHNGGPAAPSRQMGGFEHNPASRAGFRCPAPARQRGLGNWVRPFLFCPHSPSGGHGPSTPALRPRIAPRRRLRR